MKTASLPSQTARQPVNAASYSFIKTARRGGVVEAAAVEANCKHSFTLVLHSPIHSFTIGEAPRAVAQSDHDSDCDSNSDTRCPFTPLVPFVENSFS